MTPGEEVNDCYKRGGYGGQCARVNWSRFRKGSRRSARAQQRRDPAAWLGAVRESARVHTREAGPGTSQRENCAENQRASGSTALGIEWVGVSGSEV